MALIPALCNNCGTAFGVKNLIGGSGSAMLSLRGNSYGPCPTCGGTATLLDGDFRLENDIAEFLSGPEITRDVLERLKAVIESGQKEHKSPEEILESVTAAVPEVAAFTSKKSGLAAIVITAILTTMVTDALKPLTEMITKPIAARLQALAPAPPAPSTKQNEALPVVKESTKGRVNAPRNATQRFKKRANKR